MAERVTASGVESPAAQISMVSVWAKAGRPSAKINPMLARSCFILFSDLPWVGGEMETEQYAD
jgi:hypothetical protein